MFFSTLETRMDDTMKKMPSQFLPFLLIILSLKPAFSLNQDGLFLLQVKLSLSDPTSSLSSWNSRDQTPCSWYGIACHPSTHDVVSVNLSSSQLWGPFPSFLCRLPNLTSISLDDNFINSSLSASTFSNRTASFPSPCPKVEYLNLTSNLLVGPLPDTLTELPSLRVLDLSYNNFSGPIPARFGEFPQLEKLVLYGSLLGGTIPGELANVSTLKDLSLAYNLFDESEVPVQLANLTNLEVLWLAGCNFVGSIPDSYSRLTKLTAFDLSYNRLTGPFPGWITQLNDLTKIELYNNSLTGELPGSGFSNLKNLRMLDASTNLLTGRIPDELCQLGLESLNLFENSFEGTLPESIAESPNLQELKLFTNKLTGTLPARLGMNSKLTVLDVTGNNFTGEISRSLCAKGTLEKLDLMRNSFSGTIPESLGNCQSLDRVRLKDNLLSGPVPDGLWGHPSVTLLELSGNLLTGLLSRSIGSASNLSVLLIGMNRFSGSIPMEIGALSNLVDFIADGNMFNGEIPGSLVNLPQLSILDLSDNQLTGGFPEGIQGWTSLNDLNLANNKLSGPIPEEIGNLTVLNFLDLSGNLLSGKIPDGLEKLKLNMLNLSNNRLSGNIPPLYAKDAYKSSFLGNPGLCGDIDGLCPKKTDSKSATYVWILRSIFILAGLTLVAGVVWFYVKYQSLKRRRKQTSLTKWRSFHKLGFSEFEVIECIKEDNLIGAGSSGKVYKVVLGNGEIVAVKKLSKKLSRLERVDATGPDSSKDEFEMEVETLGKIRHKNIVKLWCSCNAADSKLLVYEYMPNGSLGDLLHSNKGGLLDWPMRYKIALDAAEGLSYLHHDCVPPIVHRDVKSNNILLDAEFGARVADFGVAKFVHHGVNEGIETMSVIAGSCGYIAPEYAYTLRVNEKSDIYSFGVVLLELVTGRVPTDPELGEKDLVKWACSTLDQHGLDRVVDSELDHVHKDRICRVLEVALQCTHSLPINRPSMRKVVKMLQEAHGESRGKASKREGTLSPYYQEDDRTLDKET